MIRSLLGFWIQSVATAAGLLAIGLTGIWMLPPWWAPYAFGVVLLLVTLTGLRRRSPFASVLPLTVAAWTVAALFVGLGGVALDQAARALAGRAPPPARLVELQFPLERISN